MNTIDYQFQELVEQIQKKSKEEIFTHIRNRFLEIPIEIQASLEDYFEKFPYWGKLKTKEGIFEELHLRVTSIKDHIDDFVFLYHQLEDYRSKKVLYAILNNWYDFDFKTLGECQERNYSHYFDLDVIQATEKEVFVDLGAYIGDTVLDYLNQYGANQYQKIYCYEITEDSFETLKNNLSSYPNITLRKKAVSDQEGILYFQKSVVDHSANMVGSTGEEEIESITLDQDITEKVTMIKMDIEGSEEKAILGAKRHITEEHPKMLISVYHNHEDIWKIPKMLKEMWDGYHFRLRYYGNHIFPTEIVLLATEN